MNNLEYLSLSISYQNPESIDVIKNLTNLKYLYLSGGKINSLESIKNLTKLEDLIIYGYIDEVENLDSLQNLTKLKRLIIQRYNSSNEEKVSLDYSSLQNLTNLESLSIKDNNSTLDASYLENLIKLYNLNLEVNSITNINKIGTLTQLEYIAIQNSKIKDICFVKTLTNLYSMRFDNNQITDITPIEEINADVVFLRNNLVNPETEGNARVIEKYKDRTLLLTEYSKTQNLQFNYPEFKEKLVQQYDLNRDEEISIYEMEQITYLSTDGKLENA